MNLTALSLAVRKIAAVPLGLALWCTVVVSDSRAEEAQTESGLSGVISVDLLSDYMWRGFNLYRGFSIQPQLEVAHTLGDLGTIKGLVWSHFSTQGDRNVDAFTEIDYTLAYEYAWEGFSVEVGHLWYSYPRKADDIADTNEVYASVAFDLPLAPSISWYRDYKEFDSNYFELALVHDFETDLLGTEVVVSPAVEVGFGHNAEKYYAKDGLEQITYLVAASFPVGELSLTPNVSYTDGIDQSTVNRFWGGVNLSYEF